MISKKTVLDCLIRSCKTSPALHRGEWRFAGFIPQSPNSWQLHLRTNCPCVYPKISLPLSEIPKTVPKPEFKFQYVELTAHVLIDADLLEIVVWFGVCPACGDVIWMASAPPYRRVLRSEQTKG